MRRGPVPERDPLEPAVRQVEREVAPGLDDQGKLERQLERLGEELETLAAFLPRQASQVHAGQDGDVEHNESGRDHEAIVS